MTRKRILYLVIRNAQIGYTLKRHFIKHCFLCNITIDFAQHSLDHCRRPTKNSDRARAAVPMGRRADLPASALDDREGVYIKPQSAVVTTETARKNKKALLNMAGIVIRTRQAVSLNCFSAVLKIRQKKKEVFIPLS